MKAHARHDRLIHILADGAAPSRLTIVFRFPLGIVFRTVIPLRNDGQAMLAAKFVRYAPHLGIGFLVVVIAQAVGKGHGVDDKMIMDALRIEVRRHDHLKAVAPQPGLATLNCTEKIR